MTYTRMVELMLENPPPFVAFFSVLGVISFMILHRYSLRGDSAVLVEATFFSVLFYIRWSAGASKLSAVTYATLAVATHGLSLILLTVAYRLSPLHPLADFPGPLLNKITSLRLAQIVISGKRHITVEGYHRRYGNFVRTAPNTLSINSNAAMRTIYMSAACFNKSNAYLLRHIPGDGLFFMVDRDAHHMRRGIWAPAFTRAAVDGYRPALERRTLQLCSSMEETQTQALNAVGSIDLVECIRHWSYDVMGDIVFGGASHLELMAEGDPQELVKCGQSAAVNLEVLGQVSWLFDILCHLPVTRHITKLQSTARRLVRERFSDTNGPHNDICSYLMGEHGKKPVNLPEDDLVKDALFAMQAGSDTTSSVLVLTFTCILSHPDIHERLLEELDSAFPDAESVFSNFNALANLPLLNAVVNETLRLGTPFPGLPRVVPDGGIVLDDRSVPGGTVVGVPGYSQQISEENFFPEPLAFKPDRWLPGGLGPGSRCRRSAMLSFSFGPFGCLGKSIALQQMRAIIAYLLLTFDMQLAPEFSVDAFWEGITNLKSTFFAHPLRVQVRRWSAK